MAFSSRGTSDLTTRPGFHFVANHMVSSSWKTVTVLMMIERRLLDQSETTLEALLRTAKRRGKKIFLLVDPNGDVVRKIRQDEDIQASFLLFVQIMTPPLDLRDFKMSVWFSRMMLPLVILTGSKFKWKNISFEILFPHSKLSRVATMLKYMWNEVGIQIKQDLIEINNNPSLMFCDSCNSSCPFKLRPFHLDLSRFRALEFFSNLAIEDTLGRYRLFGAGRPTGDEILLRLGDAYAATVNYSWQNVMDITNLIDLRCNGDDNGYCCYMLAIFQGHETDMAEITKVGEMMKSRRIFKFIYIGVTHGTSFRLSHFTDKKSAVNKALSKKSRLFVLRRFNTPSKTEAYRNESFCIDLLKTLIKTKVQNKEVLDFFFLNQTSGQMQLLGLDFDYVKQILDFVDSDTPVLSADSSANDETRDPSFPGNFSLNNEVDLEDETYEFQNRSYTDVKTYLMNVRSRCRMAKWTEFRTD